MDPGVSRLVGHAYCAFSSVLVGLHNAAFSILAMRVLDVDAIVAMRVLDVDAYATAEVQECHTRDR